jgi:adenylosuccinate lyase
LSIPEPFLAIDGCLQIVLNVARGLVVYPKTIEAAVNAELPFMASEEILMAGVQAGGDRQNLHELIRRHSLAAAEQVKNHGQANDLIERLRGDKAFSGLDLSSVLKPSHFTGRAGTQVERFVAEQVRPALARYQSELGASVSLKV